MDVEAIAKKLTPAQRDALVRKIGRHEVITATEVEPLWFSIYKLGPQSFRIGLTQTGLAVRDYLIKEGK